MAKSKHVVSLDFDGVLAQGWEVKRRYAKKWFGVELLPHQSKKDAFESLMVSLGKSITYRDLMDPLNERHIMDYFIPEGCLEVLERLYKKEYSFVVVSSRNEHDFPYAQDFVREKFGDLICGVYSTFGDSKIELLRTLSAEFHVDDDISKLVQIRSLPLELVYFRQPENAGMELETYSSRICEVSSFLELEDVILGIEGRD